MHQNQKAPDYERYLEAYWTKKLYYFVCHTLDSFSIEGKDKDDCDKQDLYVALVPPDFNGEQKYANIYTTDAEKFWSEY